MTVQIYSQGIGKIIKNKKQIETSLEVKIEVKDHIVIISGKPEQEQICLQAIEAMDLGFTAGHALELKDDDFIFEKIRIKKLAKRKDLSQVRARIIGTERKVLRNIEFLTDCDIVLHDNIVSIIGRLEDVKKAAHAIKRLVTGSEHASVYKYLEEQKALEKQTF